MSEIIVNKDTVRDSESYVFREKGTFNFISVDSHGLVEVEQ
jgi:hypothetical protein